MRGGLIVAIIAIAAASWQRACAVDALPPDFDELPYLHAGFEYAQRMESGHWREIPHLTENQEHPPLVKLVYGVALKITHAPEPNWDALPIGKPMPVEAQPAFRAGRWVSAVTGVAQVAVVAAVHPLAGLLLAVDGYHAKYTAQAYLEGIPGLCFVLALLFFERAARRREPRARTAALAFALLGAAAAGKYSFGALGALALTPLAVLAFRRRPLVWVVLVAAAALAFVALDPYLWPNPAGRLAASIQFHLDYGRSEHVTSAALPWYQQIVWLFKAAPTSWHPGVFPLGWVTVLLVPLALVGAPVAARKNPTWAFTALAGVVFLLLWPVKWPQYLMLVLAPLAVCAAHAPATIARVLRGRGADPTP